MPQYLLPRRQKSVLAAAARRLLPLALAALLIAVPLPPSADAGSRAFTDMAGHWAAPLVAKALEDGLASGYGDGTFRPDKPVSEAEYLALLLRAYDDAAPRRNPTESWKAAYYDRAFERGWPLTFHDEAAGFRRGQAARLTAVAANGTAMDEDEAIEWMLRTGIAKGRSGSGAEGYAPDGFLTRAEALAMIYRLKAALPELSTAAVQLPDTALQGISLRDHVDKLLYLLGEPSRIDKSEYDYDWYVYSRDYGRFAMFGVSKRRIVALYSADPDSWTSRDRLRLGTPLAEARRSLGDDKLKQAKAEYASYELNGDRTTLFLDTMEQNKLAAMLVQETAAAAKKSRSHSPELRNALERQLFDLTNAERAARGIELLEWDAKAAAAARKHSEDMRDRSYFNHQSPGGSTPFDRMEAQGIEYRSASENIAAGFADSMLAHYTLLNSEEHRKSILSAKLERMGTGVALGGKYKYYYTQDFYTPY